MFGKVPKGDGTGSSGKLNRYIAPKVIRTKGDETFAGIVIPRARRTMLAQS